MAGLGCGCHVAAGGEVRGLGGCAQARIGAPCCLTVAMVTDIARASHLPAWVKVDELVIAA